MKRSSIQLNVSKEKDPKLDNFEVRGVVRNEGMDVYRIDVTLSDSPLVKNISNVEILYCMKRDNNGKLLPVFSITKPYDGYIGIDEVLYDFNVIYEATMNGQYGDENHNNAINLIDSAFHPVFYFFDEQSRLIREVSSLYTVYCEYDDETNMKIYDRVQYKYSKKSRSLKKVAHNHDEFKDNKIFKSTSKFSKGSQSTSYTKDGVRYIICVSHDLVGSTKQIETTNSCTKYTVYSNSYTPDMYNIEKSVSTSVDSSSMSIDTITETLFECISYYDAKRFILDENAPDQIITKYPVNSTINNDVIMVTHHAEYSQPGTDNKLEIRLKGCAKGISKVYKSESINIDYTYGGNRINVEAENDNTFTSRVNIYVYYDHIDVNIPEAITSLVVFYNSIRHELEEQIKDNNPVEVPVIKYLIYDICQSIALYVGKNDDPVSYMSRVPNLNHTNKHVSINDYTVIYFDSVNSRTMYTFYNGNPYHRVCVVSDTANMNILFRCVSYSSLTKFDVLPENIREHVKRLETDLRNKLMYNQNKN